MSYQQVPESEKAGFKVAPVRVGKYVFVGAGAKILPGVTIGDGALTSAGAIVARDVEAFAVVSGNPAEMVGDTRKLDSRYLKARHLLEWYQAWQKG